MEELGVSESPGLESAQFPNLITGEQNGGSRTIRGINRKPVASGSGGAGQKAGVASGRVGGSRGTRGHGGWRGCGGGGPGGGKDRVHRGAEGSRRQQDQCNQGGPRSHQPGSERSQGTGRRSAQEREGRGLQGRGRDHQEEVHRSRCDRGSEVSVTRVGTAARGRPAGAGLGWIRRTGRPRRQGCDRTRNSAKSIILTNATCEALGAVL